jgi:hypothetical protein
VLLPCILGSKILIRMYLYVVYNTLTPWSKVLLEKLIVMQPVKKFHAFYETWRFITILTRACHWSLSWDRWIQSTPSHCISLRSSLILSSHLCLGLPGGLFPSGIPTQIFVWISHISCVSYMPHTSHPLDLIILIVFCEVYKLWSSSLCSLLRPPTTSSLLGPHILSTLFSNTLSLWSYLSVRDQVSHPYKEQVKSYFGIYLNL